MRVRAAGRAKPRGTVIVKRIGKVVVRLPKLSRGKYKISVTYKPNAKSKEFVTKAKAKAKAVTLRVT